MNAHPRLSLNQATIKYADLATALSVTREAGIQSIGLWREPVAEVGLADSAKMLSDSGLRFSTYCRGGFFTHDDSKARQEALDDNRRAIEEAATLASESSQSDRPVLVLVAGGLPEGSKDIMGARRRVLEALSVLADDAKGANVTLAVEPLHPMYASDRAVISTLGQALDLVSDFDPSVAGVAVDTFHTWWDPDVQEQIKRAGNEGRIATYQVCDWATPLPEDVLLSRHYPGDGVIDFASLTRAVEHTGYIQDVEVELFNADIWNTPHATVVERVVRSFNAAVSPHLGG